MKYIIQLAGPQGFSGFIKAVSDKTGQISTTFKVSNAKRYDRIEDAQIECNRLYGRINYNMMPVQIPVKAAVIR